MDEEWRDIDEYPGYSVSSRGNVKSRGRWGKPIILAKFQMKGRAPYMYVNVYRNRKMFTRRVSVLVCQAFWGPRPSQEHEAAHNNGIHDDDRSENLRWATRKENAADRKLHGTQVLGEAVSLSKLSADAVREIRKSGSAYGTQIALARRFGVGRSTISNITKNKTWRHVS